MNWHQNKKGARAVTVVCTVFVLFGATFVPVENVHSSSFPDVATIISQIRTYEGTQEISIEMPVEGASILQQKLRNESSDEKIFELLKYYGLIPENIGLSDIKEDLRSLMGKDFVRDYALFEIINNTYGLDKNIYFNFLSYSWIALSCMYVISIGTSSPKGLLNFPLYLLGMLLSGTLFPQSMPLQLLLIYMILISSTDIIDVAHAWEGDITYFTERPGREDVYFNKPFYALLMGFHGVHITLIFPVHGGGYEIGHIFWGVTLSTIIIPE